MMRPWFTSRAEWRALEARGERAYVRSASGYVARASILGFVSLVLIVGSGEPYWRSAPVLVVFAASLAVGLVLSALLFRREWRAAASAYGGGS